MEVHRIDPYVRAAMIQPAVLEGAGFRKAFDHRLFLVLAGSGMLITECGEYRISQDSIMIFPPGFGYCFRGKMRMLVLNFDMTRVSEQCTVPVCPPPAENFDPRSIFDAMTTERLPVPFVSKADEKISGELTELVGCYDQKNNISDALCSSGIKHIIALLLKNADGDVSGRALSERVKEYIRLNAPQIASNEHIARHFGYHPVYLAAVFRRETGESLHTAVLSARVTCAARWLTAENCSIDEIAYSAGFSSRSHFCTVFREKTGMTPGAYRKAVRNHADESVLPPTDTEHSDDVRNNNRTVKIDLTKNG